MAILRKFRTRHGSNTVIKYIFLSYFRYKVIIISIELYDKRKGVHIQHKNNFNSFSILKCMNVVYAYHIYQ